MEVGTKEYLRLMERNGHLWLYHVGTGEMKEIELTDGVDASLRFTDDGVGEVVLSGSHDAKPHTDILTFGLCKAKREGSDNEEYFISDGESSVWQSTALEAVEHRAISVKEGSGITV